MLNLSELSEYKFDDGSIKEIRLLNNTVEVLFSQWNEKLMTLVFEEYWKLKDSNSIDVDVSEVLITSDSKLLKEVIQEIIDGDGTEEEASGLKQYTFLSAWGNRAILEIVARNVTIKEQKIEKLNSLQNIN